MIENILFYAHYAITLLFGIVLSYAFCGIRFTGRTNGAVFLTFAVLGAFQLAVFGFFDEALTWKLYPLIVHLPLGILFCTVYGKRVITAAASIALSYLCCQPAKWFGLFAETFIQSSIAVTCIRIFVILFMAFVTLRFLASYISGIFGKDSRSVLIFSGVPLVYYIFDYDVGVYTELWNSHSRVAAEFLSFFLCISFVAFCVIYYKEYEKKIEAENKEQIIRIAAEQQAKEVETIKKSSLEVKLLRHDMRLMLSSVALCIERNDNEQALKTISGFVKQVEATSLHRYCENDTINYILTNFESKCRESETAFCASIEIDELPVDEVMFSSIISNALDNALNAQAKLPVADRQIKLMLKNSDGKLLLSVKNPFKDTPVFKDGMPITDKKGHGYGTQSIWYMTEKLGGKCQFIVQNNMFVVRVVFVNTKNDTVGAQLL